MFLLHWVQLDHKRPEAGLAQAILVSAAFSVILAFLSLLLLRCGIFLTPLLGTATS